MGVGGVQMELGIVVMLVDVVVSVFIDLHITWVEFMLVLELFVTLVLLLGGFILVAFFILIIAPPRQASSPPPSWQSTPSGSSH